MGGAQTHSPDGRSTVYEDQGELYVSSPGRSGLRNITRSPAWDTGPIWAFNSQWVAFQTNRDGNWEVYVADTVTGRLARLTATPHTVERPVGWDDSGNLMISLGGSFLTIYRAEIAKKLGIKESIVTDGKR